VQLKPFEGGADTRVTVVCRNLRQVCLQGGDVIEFINRLRDESGQTMAEYAVVLGVITIAVVVTLGLLSSAISSTLSNVISSL
jgi:Flp pilus assembly pilin Flp